MSTPLISVVVEDDGTTITVQHVDNRFRVADQHVSLAPNPTILSPKEANDLIADAVRAMLDLAYYEATGTGIER